VLGDLTAAIIGISFGKIKIGKKSLEGTLAMFSLCFLVGSCLFLSVESPGIDLIVILGSASATLAELLSPKWLDDNLSIPVASSIALTFGFRLFGIPPL
jgi:dolichol kinase